MRPMKHGYTNRTVGDAASVAKHYQGPDAAQRQETERRFVTALQGRLPVPEVVGEEPGVLRFSFVEGVQGQELIDAGAAREVLRSAGAVLRRLHDLPADVLGTPEGRVAVHGDFGPNNLLLDPVSFEVTAVIDWEFAHFGDPVEDLAWCEWIVRTHHPAHVGDLDACFDAYGPVPPWEARQAEMVARCEALEAFCERWEAGGPGARQWRERTAATAAWEA
ncbi:phosphotransferase [Glycomyces sp. NPDC047369]